MTQELPVSASQGSNSINTYWKTNTKTWTQCIGLRCGRGCGICGNCRNSRQVLRKKLQQLIRSTPLARLTRSTPLEGFGLSVRRTRRRWPSAEALHDFTTNIQKPWQMTDPPLSSMSSLLYLLPMYIVPCLKMSAACSKSGRLVAETPCHGNETWQMHVWKTWEAGLHSNERDEKNPQALLTWVYVCAKCVFTCGNCNVWTKPYELSIPSFRQIGIHMFHIFRLKQVVLHKMRISIASFCSVYRVKKWELGRLWQTTRSYFSSKNAERNSHHDQWNIVWNWKCFKRKQQPSGTMEYLPTSGPGSLSAQPPVATCCKTCRIQLHPSMIINQYQIC